MLAKLIVAAAGAIVVAFTGGSSSAAHGPSSQALADIPAHYLALYQQAAPHCPGFDGNVLAAIGKAENSTQARTSPRPSAHPLSRPVAAPSSIPAPPSGYGLWVRIQASLFVSGSVSSGTPDPCELSEKFAKAAFENLPNEGA